MKKLMEKNDDDVMENLIVQKWISFDGFSWWKKWWCKNGFPLMDFFDGIFC